MKTDEFMLELCEQVSEEGMSMLFGGTAADPLGKINNGKSCDYKNNAVKCDVVNSGTVCTTINNANTCLGVNTGVNCSQINDTNNCVPIVVNSTSPCS